MTPRTLGTLALAAVVVAPLVAVSLASCATNTPGATTEAAVLQAAGAAPTTAETIVAGAAMAGQLFCAANASGVIAVKDKTVIGLTAAAVAALCPAGSVPVPQPPPATVVPVVPPST